MGILKRRKAKKTNRRIRKNLEEKEKKPLKVKKNKERQKAGKRIIFPSFFERHQKIRQESKKQKGK